jgi:hypothetical protein
MWSLTAVIPTLQNRGWRIEPGQAGLHREFQDQSELHKICLTNQELGVSSVVAHLPGTPEALDWIPSTQKRKIKLQSLFFFFGTGI